jgi:hypothetical protein
MEGEVASWKEVKAAGCGMACGEEERRLVDQGGAGVGGGVVKRGKKEKFLCEVAKCTKRIECEGEKEDLGRIEMRDDGFIAEFPRDCFVVRLAYEIG